MEINDCKFDVLGNRFHYRVGAVIIEDGYVLLAKCDAADYYYSVGGGVHLGETAQQAVEREVFEETGIRYVADRLLFVHENFFEDDVVAVGKKVHEISLFFLMKPMGRQEISVESVCSAGVEHMHWVKIDKLSDMQVYPTFYAEKLRDLPRGVEHIVTNDFEDTI
ncbi:MAG: NUDIX domain-containing protein [Ruminococcus sp.]|nr:NUDIX domain-containing protein [Ruminococcus sp.]